MCVLGCLNVTGEYHFSVLDCLNVTLGEYHFSVLGCLNVTLGEYHFSVLGCLNVTLGEYYSPNVTFKQPNTLK
jgi:hypothetical protein